MAISYLPSGFEPIAEGILTAGEAIGKGISERNKKKEKDAMEKLQEWIAANSMKTLGATDEDILNTLGDTQYTQNKAIQDMQNSGYIPNRQNGAVPQQGLPQVSIGDIMTNKQFGFKTDAMLDREKLAKVAETLAVKKAESNAKIEESLATEKSNAKKSVPIMTDLMNLYIDSMVERESKYPGSSETSAEGRVKRIASNVESAALQTLPDTQAFKNIGRKLAYQQARAIEGGRVTNQDVDIVWDSLFNSDMPRQQAMKQANAYVGSLRNSGLSEEELAPLTSLVDMAGGQIMIDAKGNKAFVVNNKVIREF